MQMGDGSKRCQLGQNTPEGIDSGVWIGQPEMTPELSAPSNLTAKRRRSATVLSTIAALSTALWLAVVAFVELQLITGVFEGGELVFAGIFFTAPPVFISAIWAMRLVGARHCKLAWISALLWLSPLIVGLIGGLFYSGRK